MKKLSILFISLSISLFNYAQVNKSCVYELFSKAKLTQEKALIESKLYSSDQFEACPSDFSVECKKGLDYYFKKYVMPAKYDSISCFSRPGSDEGIEIYVVVLFEKGEEKRSLGFAWVGDMLSGVCDTAIKFEP